MVQTLYVYRMVLKDGNFDGVRSNSPDPHSTIALFDNNCFAIEISSKIVKYYFIVS